MKHLSEDIAAAAASVGVDIDNRTARLLANHLDWVVRISETTNLTAVKSTDDGVWLHVADSLAVVPEVNAAAEGPLLDVGTGGGYPGIPLAILSGRSTVLLDSVKKKAHLVSEFVSSCELNDITAVSARAEDYATQEGPIFGVVVARAVSGLPSLVELAAPLLVPGGTLVAMKGDLSDDERSRGQAAAMMVGLNEEGYRRYTMGPDRASRTVVSYKKCGDPKIKLPRRNGMAQKQPLA